MFTFHYAKISLQQHGRSPKIWHNDIKWFSRILTVTKKDIDDTFEKPILHHHEISQFYIRCIKFKLKIFSRCKKNLQGCKKFFLTHTHTLVICIIKEFTKLTSPKQQNVRLRTEPKQSPEILDFCLNYQQ